MFEDEEGCHRDRAGHAYLSSMKEEKEEKEEGQEEMRKGVPGTEQDMLASPALFRCLDQWTTITTIHRTRLAAIGKPSLPLGIARIT